MMMMMMMTTTIVITWYDDNHQSSQWVQQAFRNVRIPFPQPMRPDDSGKVQSILSVEPWRKMKMGVFQPRENPELQEFHRKKIMLHPRSLTVRPWKATFPIGKASNHHFSGVMLNFGGGKIKLRACLEDDDFKSEHFGGFIFFEWILVLKNRCIVWMYPFNERPQFTMASSDRGDFWRDPCAESLSLDGRKPRLYCSPRHGFVERGRFLRKECESGWRSTKGKLQVRLWTLTCPPRKGLYFNRKYIFLPSIFRGHVSFLGSNQVGYF